MIPFATYSIKVVYIITFIAFKLYLQVEIYLVPMVAPEFLSIENDPSIEPILKIARETMDMVPLANYSFNCIYCARCNLGMSCKNHVPQVPRKKS